MIDVDTLEQLPGTWRDLVADGVVGSPGEDLARMCLAARRMRELADHLEVTALGALDRDGYTDAVGATTVVWFAREAKLPHAVVRSQLAAARLLAKEMAPTARAWFDGTIGREHVKVLLDGANPRIRDRFAAEQETLIAGAVAGKRFDVWKREVTERVRLLDQDGVEPDDPTLTSASWARSDAFAQLRASFGGADAETVEQIVEAKTNELYRHQRDRKVFPEIITLTRNELRGRAIVMLLLASQAVDLDHSSAPTTSVQLVLHASGLHCPSDTDDGPDWPDLSAATDITWRLTNPDGRHLAIDHLAHLICDAKIDPLLVDADGNPLKLGRTARLAPARMRRVVLIRDGGCAFPGCDCPVSWADIHHVITWDDGGHTDIDNLVALCRRHHGLAHRKGWSLTATGDGWFIWQSPTGARQWSQRHGVQRAGPVPDLGPPRTAAA